MTAHTPERCDYCHGVGACPKCWGRTAIEELKNERAELLDALNVALAYVVTPEAFNRAQVERNLRAVLAAAEDR